MPRKTLAVVPLLLAASAVARADDEPAPARVADQELGARLGLALNLGGVGPGGLFVSGSWLYRLTDVLWFDGRAGFTIGGTAAACTFPTAAPNHCDGALVSGFGAEFLAGLRYWLPASGVISPWLAGGVGGGYVDFSGDSLTGVTLPVWGAFGARARVSDTVSVGGEADLLVGAGRYGRQIGWEGFAALRVIGGVDFAF